MKMKQIRAGWEFRLRVHGVRAETPLDVRYHVTVHSEVTDYHVELAEKPLNASMRFPLPPYLVSGEAAPAFSNETPPLPAGSWLTVIAARELSAPADLVEAFQRNPGNPENSNALMNSLAGDLGSIREAGELFAGAFAVELTEVQPALWHEGAVLWFTEIDNRRLSDVAARVLVNPPSVDIEMLTRLASLTACVMASSARVRTVVSLCSRWLIQAHAMPHFSNERFVTCFQALEAMCGVAESRPTEIDEAGFATLERIAIAADGAERDTALNFLERLRQRCLAPPLTERFRRLAKQYQPDAVDVDVPQFHAVRKARNGLLHGRTSTVAGTVDGVEVHDAVNDLATRYLGALMNATVEQSPVSIEAAPRKEE